jgi:cell wall assembly regulator SMI1
MQAIRASRADIVEVLLDAGADPHLRWGDDLSANAMAGKTPLEFAREKKVKKIVALLEAPRGAEAPAAPKPKQRKTTPAASWKRIDAWLEQHQPKLKETLCPGASDADFKAVEKAVGAKLPADFKMAYKIHDGQKFAEGNLVPPLEGNEESYFLLSLKHLLEEWQTWKGLLDAGEFKDQASGPDKGIRSQWWHPGWIPFASNGGGDFLCIDLAPTEEGVSGQVITMSHESAKRELLAGCFAEWLAALADGVETEALRK